MFIGNVDLGNGTGLELVIVPLKGTNLPGMWSEDTDLLMLCVVQTGKCCTFRPDDHYSRYQDKLGLYLSDAKHLASWMQSNTEKYQ